jgi:predicted NUDIX family NTP pyrophosphohydrolase
MPKRSAGLVMIKRERGDLRVLLVHPGGPFWAKKDEGAWSIPKGEYETGENPLAVAKREFIEELGPAGERALRDLPDSAYIPIGEVKQPGGKIVTAFAVQGDVDCAAFVSNSFTMEWPPRSGRMQSFPEIDRAAFFTLDEARRRILKGQVPLLDALAEVAG